MKLLSALPVGLFVLLLLGAIWGKASSYFTAHRPVPDADVTVTVLDGKADGPLYVMVHGMGGLDSAAGAHWKKIAATLTSHGDVALVSYPSAVLSNADPEGVARLINAKVQDKWAGRTYPRVVLVGNSMGALIARKALLYGLGATGEANAPAPSLWAGSVRRIVLLAGMNRGWDLSGDKPSDMRWHQYVLLNTLAWFGRLTHSGQLALKVEAGAPFVSNLRIEWMRWARDNQDGDGDKPPVETVQLLGDIDELVSASDNEDLRVNADANFAWLTVRGTNHSGILEMDGSEQIGAYRRAKFLGAIDLGVPFATLRRQSEELPYTTDNDVTKIVFVMHGIRDLGEWSSQFETALQARAQASPGAVKPKLAIASVRYGYFGMGQFLLRRDRQKYVRWFMDQYTETLARYPNATEVDFVGHSNGSYLLASALATYRSMKIDRVVLGGSVVPRAYDWDRPFVRKQVSMVRNYVAQDDWVVALFPAFFEKAPMSLLGNDIGSAGFNGFDAGDPATRRWPIENIAFVKGQHAAFLLRTEEIAAYLLPFDGAAGNGAGINALSAAPVAPFVLPLPEPARSSWLLKLISDYLLWALWAGLAFVVVWLGSRVSGAAGNFSAIALFCYLFVLFQVLRWV